MLSKIREKLLLHLVGSNFEVQILETVEALGMLPPSCHKIDEEFATKINQREVDLIMSGFKWENEDG